MFALVLAAVSLIAWFVLATDWFLGMRSLTRLQDHHGPLPERWPTVSVVIPARNEAEVVRDALRSVLALDYPALEVIVLDDRSDDATGAILDDMKRHHPALEVVHIRELPSGWLGKNHALWLGARQARGDWLLFTDADVVYRADALKRTVAYALERRLDHLVALPYFVAHGPLLTSFVTGFSLLFSVYSRLWRASDPRSRAAAGIGAFGLVRRTAYRGAGGHQAIRLRPDDDLSLGRLLKGAGYRQEAIFATEVISVEWYPTLAAALRGLEKNAFAGLGYSLPRVLAVVLALLVTHVWPFVALPFVAGATRWLIALTLLVVVAVYGYNARFSRHSPLYVLLHPLAVTLLAYAALAAAVTTLARGGIVWRGTRYPLDELRKAGRR